MDLESDGIILSIGPSPARRYFAVICFVTLALVLIGLVVQGSPSFVWQAFFLGTAIASLLGAKRLYQGTDDEIELTRSELRTKSGRLLTTIDNVNVVERGPFAFKPSNGFLVRLHAPCGKGWTPGLFWQRGTYLGVGGAINAGHTRAMAEAITALKMDVLPMDEGLF
jgi:hypothetical protein